MNQRFCNGMIHVIKAGENLYQLSRKYRVPLALILRANPYVDVYNLQPGQEICIPMSRPVVPFPGNRPPMPRETTLEERREEREEQLEEQIEELFEEREERNERMERDDREEDVDYFITNGVMSLAEVLQQMGITAEEMLKNNHLEAIILAPDVKLMMPKKV